MATQPIRDGAPKVLLLEDEKDIRDLIVFFLSHEGFEVEELATGAEGASRLEGDPPSVFILDLMLPHVDGFEILRRVRETPDWDEVPVLVLSAKAAEGDIVNAFKAGADDYVVKPFQLEEIVARLRRLLGPAGRSRRP